MGISSFMDCLRLQGLQFYGYHGTEPWEKQTGCRFSIDLELRSDFTSAAKSDRLEDAIDYRAIYERSKAVVEGENHDLIETIARRLLHEMFQSFNVEEVTVRVAKPEARIGGINRAVEIEMTRTRKQWTTDAGSSPL